VAAGARTTWATVGVDALFPLWEPENVRIVSERRIREFIAREPRAADAMWHWVDVIEPADWRNPGDLKATFASASFVGDLTVFDVGGNKYRIAGFVHYRKQILYIKRIATHEEYDEWEL
jgi:mRNA interferase HigB